MSKDNTTPLSLTLKMTIQTLFYTKPTLDLNIFHEIHIYFRLSLTGTGDFLKEDFKIK